MTEERKSDSRIWWVVGLVLVILLGLCLCTACLAVAGAAAFFNVSSSTTTYHQAVPMPERVVPVPEEAPVPQQEEPEFRMQSGAQVLTIQPGSPADGVGWEPGDVIIAVDGRALGSNYDLQQALAEKKPGDMVSFDWWSRRTRALQTVQLQLGSNPDGSGRAYLGIEYRMRP